MSPSKITLYGFLVITVILVLNTTFVPHVLAQEDIIELIPTDDAYVLVNLQDPQDIQELRKLNSGDLNHLKIGYAINTADTPNQNLSTALLKFNLGDLSNKQIDSAKLRLYADQLQLSEPQDVGVFLVNNSTWNESTITYENMPSFSDLISTVTIDSVDFYQWDLKDVIKQNIDSQLSLMVSFVTLLPNTEDIIIFASKDSSLPDYYPTLIIQTSNLQNTTNTDSNVVKITPTNDTFIGLDLTTLDDPLDLRNLQSGNLDFIKIWYSNNVTSAQEFIVTSGLLTFDLSEINVDDIASANLKMKTIRVDSSGADKILSITKVNNTNWSESEITYNTKPIFELQDSLLVEITESDAWQIWNVTNIVKENTDSKLSLSLAYKSLYSGHEEQTVFYSKESNFSPYLEITLKEQEGGGCLIATATYGSELAPQVQQLRELRDNHLLQTSYGSAFMTGFNQLYYSFSPTIADLERENPIFKELVKLSITPLISSLSILNHVDMDSEESVLGYGISLILFNLGVYFVAPAMLFWNIKNYLKKN